MRKKSFPWLLLLPQLFFGLLFLSGILLGLGWSFGLSPLRGGAGLTLRYYGEIFRRADTLPSILYSVKTSALSALFSVLLGVLIAAFMIRSRWDRGILLSVIKLPILVPHVITALFFINTISQNGLLARLCFHFGWIQSQGDFPLFVYDRFGIGVILAYLWKEAPFIAYFVLSLMAGVSRRLGEAAVNLGATERRAFFEITLPLCLPTILSGFLIIFTFSLGAYELPALMGATVPKALPILAYQEFQKDLSNRPIALSYNGILMGLSLLSALIYRFLLIGGERREK